MNARTLIAAALAATLATAAQAEAPVQRDARGWHIQPQGLGLAELAQALAAASGSRLAGATDALQAASGPRRATALHGASLDAAWALLLDGRVNHARQCSGDGARERCTLWLVSARSPGAAVAPAPPDRPFAPAEASTPMPLPTSDPPGLFPSEPES